MLGAVLLSYLNAAEADEWLLAAREGGCAPVSILEKRGPEFRGIESPDQRVEKMRAAGEKVAVKEHKADSRPTVEVRIPGAKPLHHVREERFLPRYQGREEIKGALGTINRPPPPAGAADPTVSEPSFVDESIEASLPRAHRRRSTRSLLPAPSPGAA
jgi:hypothetical protein